MRLQIDDLVWLCMFDIKKESLGAKGALAASAAAAACLLLLLLFPLLLDSVSALLVMSLISLYPLLLSPRPALVIVLVVGVVVVVFVVTFQPPRAMRLECVECEMLSSLFALLSACRLLSAPARTC